jgi:hypothetical protein
MMDGQETALAFVWVAVGIVAGFVVWSYVGPMITRTQ